VTRSATVTLSLVQGRLETTEYAFGERTTCILGRAGDCSPRLPDDEHHRTVSRHHCLLDINPPDVRIRDFGSRNGTFVNDQKIGQREAHQTPEQAAALSFPEHDLADGDEIRLGRTVFRVGVRAPAAAERKPTLVVARCAKCDREVAGEIGARSGSYLCAACQAEPAAVLQMLLDGARDEQRADLAPVAGYALVRELGRGGMGVVYLARHQSTGQEVALKVMLPRVAASAAARARFLREAALTRALRHPNIAALHDVGFADATFYFTTEYCAGGSLDQLLERRGGRLPAGEAMPLVLQALDGLEHAHGQGVVHRDLTPSNILLAEDGEGRLTAKVSDFGLAKAFDQAGLSGLTLTGATAGKPWYLPRQQVINFRNAAPAVDVWALAACLYHCLTGQYPRDFPPGQDPWQVVLQQPPEPIRRRAPGVPPPLAEAIDQALREHPKIGFQTTADLRRALSRAL
jgi:pSer/pThr/pTyr-binding forkhead associated (FHA) protein